MLLLERRTRALCAVMGSAGVLTCSVMSGAKADENTPEPLPLIEGSLLIEVENDLRFKSDDPSTEIDDLFTTSELALTFNLSRLVSVHTLLILEPVFDPMPFDDRFLEDHGAYAEELFLQVAFDSIRIYAGKFDAPFGQAWDVTPGIYGVDFAEDYELAERLGGGFEIGLGDMYSGTHTVSASVFFADTTRLSRSLFNNRGQTSVGDSGPSNTKSIDSFSVAIDGGEIPGLENYTYHIGLRHQSPGRGDVSNELGMVANVQGAFDLANGAALEGIIEAAFLNHADTGPDDLFYLTIGGVYSYGPWALSASYTLRDVNVSGGSNFSDHLLQFALGYQLLEGLTIDAGYKFAEEGGIDDHTFGLLLAYELDFEFGESPNFPFLP